MTTETATRSGSGRASPRPCSTAMNTDVSRMAGELSRVHRRLPAQRREVVEQPTVRGRLAQDALHRRTGRPVLPTQGHELGDRPAVDVDPQPLAGLDPPQQVGGVVAQVARGDIGHATTVASMLRSARVQAAARAAHVDVREAGLGEHRAQRAGAEEAQVVGARVEVRVGGDEDAAVPRRGDQQPSRPSAARGAARRAARRRRRRARAPRPPIRRRTRPRRRAAAAPSRRWSARARGARARARRSASSATSAIVTAQPAASRSAAKAPSPQP